MKNCNENAAGWSFLAWASLGDAQKMYVLQRLARERTKLFNDSWGRDLGLIFRLKKSFDARAMLGFLAVDEKSCEQAGVIVFDDYNGVSASFSAVIEPKFRGQQAVSRTKPFIHAIARQLKLKKLKAEVFSGNTAPIIALSRLGFEKEATLHSETLVNGKVKDIDIYSLRFD